MPPPRRRGSSVPGPPGTKRKLACLSEKCEKRSGMLRVPQHERKKINAVNSFPFVTSINSVQALSAVEGLLRVFQQPAE